VKISGDPFSVADQSLPDLARISRHHRKADQVPGVVVLGGDDDIGRELAAVLADKLHLLFVATPALGDLQRPLRRPALDLVGGIEAAEILADDLGRRVALDPLGAGVPVCTRPWGLRRKMA
jgi:hypothetical protein